VRSLSVRSVFAHVHSGHWLEELFTLDADQLAAVDHLPRDVRAVFKDSFQSALTRLYGVQWPMVVRAALDSMAWGRDIVPPLPRFTGLEQLSAVIPDDME
jgi:hypothetical protein